MVNERNYGIDLLRIISMFFICVFHVLGQGGILDASAGFTNSFLWLVKTITMCCIDIYALISGYVSTTKKINLTKIIDMWFQVFFYSFIITCILKFFNIGESFGIKDFIKVGLPILTDKYWYFTAYVPLFILMPTINSVLDNSNEDDLKKLFILLIVVFSIPTLAKDNYASYGGSFLWLLILFIEGGIIRRINLFKNYKKKTLLSIYTVCILASWGYHCIFNSTRFIQHSSTTILFASITLFILVANSKVNWSFIKYVSPLVFGVYLLQNNIVIWNDLLRHTLVFAANNNLFIVLAYVLFFSLILFFVGLLVEWIRRKLFEIIKISKLSTKIGNIIETSANKLLAILHI